MSLTKIICTAFVPVCWADALWHAVSHGYCLHGVLAALLGLGLFFEAKRERGVA